MKDLIAKLHSDYADQILATFSTLEMQLQGFAKSSYEKDLRIAELEAQIAAASAPVVEQQPVARVTQGTQFGPSLAFLANGKALPKPGTLLYAAALSVTPVAWAVTSDNTKGIHKLSMTRESADRKAAVWLEEWPNNPVRVRPLVFADATPPTADTSSLRDAILKLPLPNGQTEDGAFRDLSSWEREVFVRGALSMRKDAADLAASTALQAPVREVPEGWAFSTADFSVQASGSSKYGYVTLKRDAKGSAAWHALDDMQKDATELYLYGKGETVAEAIADAVSKIDAAPLPAAPVQQEPKP